ncbi:hypothetical protein C7H62_1737 [Mesoflavibacter sp. HG96]|uniref:DUF2262 domain-containing protein n=1 Tax=Mesoflavibacter profundi TaxID=2708110 RepID=A0ABT4S3G0_9FLAO|nr:MULTISPECIES: hypothetical protein [Mesoflavibacter]MDA0178607.1 hypothetical protein [Mesoflavibacter profundi]QIJ89546.1 hypothetical protein C7H62_1737 [Mesoflavibacter sp. HG96]QIJ92274.1 hypothetical protein C7H56_1737 [Mesoflavibacter sp. HG37]
MRNPKNIKELLEIDTDFLYRNSEFKADLISDHNKNRNFLLFDLKAIFFGLFDQILISVFDKKARHLELRSSNYENSELKKLIDLLINEYGNDENDQNWSDWKTFKQMTWWFKNDIHEQTYDDYKNKDDLYYGLMISEDETIGLSLAIIEYSNIDFEFDKKNWLQQHL